MLHIANVVHKVGAIEDVGVHTAGGVPHKVGQEALTGDGHLVAVVIGVGAVVAGTGHMLIALVIGGIVGLFQRRGVVGLEHHHLQLVAVEEGLMADGGHGGGQLHQLGFAAGEGHSGHADGVLRHLSAEHIGNLAVQRALIHHNVVADFKGVQNLGLAGLLILLLLREGGQDTHGEGVVAQGLNLIAQGDGEGGVILLHKGVVAHLLGTAQVGGSQCGIGKGVIADVGGRIHTVDGGQLIRIGEGALADGGTLLVQGDGGQRGVVHESVLADLLSRGQVHGRQCATLGKGVLADGLHRGGVDGGQRRTTGKGVGLDLLNLLAQGDRHHIAAIGKGVLADLLGLGQGSGRNTGRVVGVHIAAIATHGSHAHLVVQAHIVHVTGQGVIAERDHSGQVNVHQAGVVVERHLLQLGAGAQGNLLQAGRIAKGVLADDNVLADGDVLQGGGKGVVEVTLAVHVLARYLKGGILIHTKGVLAQHDVVAHHNGGQLRTLAEHALSHLHLIGDDHLSDVGEGKGITTDLGLGGKLRQGGDAGLEEGILADVGQLTQGDGSNLLGRAKGVITHLGHVG